jgi:phage anti-repressor protein
MENFIRKYATIPDAFIKDFFNISKSTYEDNELAIDFNIVVRWVGVRKDNLKALLIKNKNLMENRDYIIEKVKKMNKNNKGANYEDKILLTPDCFKSLCMMLNTKRGNDVRQYYLAIEKLIRMYHKYFEEKLQHQNDMLRANQRPIVNHIRGIIYIFRALNSGDDELLYKIGKSDELRNRFYGYNSGNANDIKPLFQLEVDDIDKVENCIKSMLQKYRYRTYKEIYEIDIVLLKKLYKLCDELERSFTALVSAHDKQEVKNGYAEMFKSNRLFMVFDRVRI